MRGMGTDSGPLLILVLSAFDHMSEEEQTLVLTELKKEDGHAWDVMTELVVAEIEVNGLIGEDTGRIVLRRQDVQGGTVNGAN